MIKKGAALEPYDKVACLTFESNLCDLFQFIQFEPAIFCGYTSLTWVLFLPLICSYVLSIKKEWKENELPTM